MGWKNWPYWVKGGIIGLIPGLFFFFLTLNKCVLHGGECYYVYLFMFPFGLLLAILYLGPLEEIIPSFLRNPFGREESGAGILFAILFNFFILGALLGWIYGKIKTHIDQKRI